MQFLVLINGGETRALRCIRMEGLQCFASKNKGFCVQIRMDGKLSQTELSSLKIYYLSLTLRVAFPLFLVLGSNAKSRHFQSRNIWQIHVVTLM